MLTLTTIKPHSIDLPDSMILGSDIRSREQVIDWYPDSMHCYHANTFNAADPEWMFFRREFDERVDKLLQDWHVPGLSMAVVEDGQTFSKVPGIGSIRN